MTAALRILMVEDDPDDALLARMLLERAGITPALTVVNTLKDLDRALAEPGWDVVVADMALPGFNGRDVLDRCRERQPRIPVIAVSGLSNDPRGPGMLEAGAAGFVAKKRYAELGAAIGRVIDRVA